MYAQYYSALKSLTEQYGDQAIVLMKKGAFYEMYSPDINYLQKINAVLQMNIGKTNSNKPITDTNPYMLGFPDYAFEDHATKLLTANFILGVYDEFPAGKVKERRLTKIYTPSMLVDNTVNRENALMCIYLQTFKNFENQVCKKIGVSITSTSTGSVRITEIYENDALSNISDELYRLVSTFNPVELLYCGDLTHLPKWIIDHATLKFKSIAFPEKYNNKNFQAEFFKNIYNIPTNFSPLEFLNLHLYAMATPALMMAFEYIFQHNPTSLKALKSPENVSGKQKLALNSDTIYQLNLINAPGEQGKCLYNILNKAKSPMGSRKLYNTLLNPSANGKLLNKQYDRVELVQARIDEYEKCLTGIKDVEKKFRKMIGETCTIREFADISTSWKNIYTLLTFSQTNFNIDTTLLENLQSFIAYYEQIFNVENMTRANGVFINPNIDPRLDELTASIALVESQCNTINDTISKLVGGSRFEKNEKGYYISVTPTRCKKLNSGFIHKFEFGTWENTSIDTRLKNQVRLSCPLLEKLSMQLINANNEIEKLMQDIYKQTVLEIVQVYGETIITICKIVAHIDMTYSVAKCALEYGYVRPQIVKGTESMYQIQNLRHPIVERINEREEYTPNNVKATPETLGTIIYGLNMAGKSTLLKAIGCCIVMAQAGMFVPAQTFTFVPFHCILSKMVIRDDLYKGHSTFMIELLEIKTMVGGANANTLVLSDELCSSTEKPSALGLVAATLNQLATSKAKFVFATHLQELADIYLIKNNNAIDHAHFLVNIDKKTGEINFNRKLVQGPMKELYGIEIAKAIGICPEVIANAFAIRDGEKKIVNTNTSRYNSKVFLTKCVQCGSDKNLETHHLKHQATANQYGIIDGFIKKNSAHNLAVLCETCHKNQHNH